MEDNTTTSNDQNGNDLIALCMKCRQKGEDQQMQKMTNIAIQEKEGKGGTIRYSAKGECEVCGTGMFKFLSKDDAMELKKEIE